MSSTLANREQTAATFLAAALAVFAAGCGSIEQAQLVDRAAGPSTTVPEAQRVPVIVGNITAGINQPAEMRESVCRHLRDLATAEIATHGAFLLVNTNAASDLMSGFGMSSTQDTQNAIAPKAAFDIEVTRLEEKLGATKKIGLVSSQRKYAVATVKVTLRSLTGGGELTSVREGKSSKGAWGVIASVDREAMKGGRETWKLDGSMIGVACADALHAGVDDLGRQTLFRAKALGAGIEKRLLRPRTERGR